MTQNSSSLRQKNRMLLICLLVVIGLFYTLSYVKFGMAARNTPADESVIEQATPEATTQPSSSVAQ